MKKFINILLTIMFFQSQLFAQTGFVAFMSLSLAPSGSTTLSFNNTASKQKQETKATMGQGNITIGGVSATPDQLAGLNRDITNSQEITYDKIERGLDGSVTVDNRLLIGFLKTEVKDKEGNAVYERDEQGNVRLDSDGNPKVMTVSGYQSLANDFTNFVPNFAKGAAGAISTVTSPVTAVYSSIKANSNSAEEGENVKYDKKDIISVWKANQSAKATGIARAGQADVNDIVKKMKEGTATPDEIQYLADYTSTGKGNLVYSKEGEIVDSTGKVVLGFNDLENHQGYVNLGSGTATNALEFFMTDAEERAHNYTGNEDVAKRAAKSEIAYYNTLSWLTGGETVGSSDNYGALARQQSWNNIYNTTTNSLLWENTYQASLVSEANRGYSLGSDIIAGIRKVKGTMQSSASAEIRSGMGLSGVEKALSLYADIDPMSVMQSGASIISNIVTGMSVGEAIDLQANANVKESYGRYGDPQGKLGDMILSGELIESGYNDIENGYVLRGNAKLGLAAAQTIGIFLGGAAAIEAGGAVSAAVSQTNTTTALMIPQENPLLAAGNAFARENPVLFKSVMKELNSMAYPSINDTVTYITKGMYNLQVGEVVQLNKAAYYAGLNELAAGNQVRIIGPYPNYLQLSEALGTKAYYVEPNVWKTWDYGRQLVANDTFLIRGSNKNATFIDGASQIDIRAGGWREWEINKLINDYGYQTNDGIIFKKLGE